MWVSMSKHTNFVNLNAYTQLFLGQMKSVKGKTWQNTAISRQCLSVSKKTILIFDGK